jgi:hypothetical protein
MKKILPDVLLIIGAAGVSYGAWMAWNPIGFIVGGALAIVAGIKLASL